MKTLKQIKDEIAREIGYESADNYLSELYEIGSIYTLERMNLFINEVAVRTSKEALKNASENAVLIDKSMNIRCKTGHGLEVDKQSILNESNIPKL